MYVPSVLRKFAAFITGSFIRGNSALPPEFVFCSCIRHMCPAELLTLLPLELASPLTPWEAAVLLREFFGTAPDVAVLVDSEASELDSSDSHAIKQYVKTSTRSTYANVYIVASCRSVLWGYADRRISLHFLLLEIHIFIKIDPSIMNIDPMI